MMDTSLVYPACFAGSAICAFLLVRSWMRSRDRILAWSAVSFLLLAIGNFVLLCDMIIAPDLDLTTLRYLASLTAVSILLACFIWKSKS